MSFEQPEYESPIAVGDELTVTGTICANNDVGGTVILAHSGIRCRVTKAFWDYETGWRYHGVPLDEADRQSVVRQCRTGHACGRGAKPLGDKLYFDEHDLPKGRP